MSLNLEISLDKDIKDIDMFFDNLRFKAIVKAARQGINRAATRTQSNAIKELRKRRKLKISQFKGKKGGGGFVTVRKATGNILDNLEGRVNFKAIPLPLIFFLLGSKQPKTQTAPNSRRRPRRFEIVKGKKQAKSGLFVQRAKRGKNPYQVFRRVDPSDPSEGFKMQSAASVAEILRKKSNLLRKIENRAIAILQKEYDTALKFQLEKLKL